MVLSDSGRLHTGFTPIRLDSFPWQGTILLLICKADNPLDATHSVERQPEGRRRFV